jgi:hypothetical protein
MKSAIATPAFVHPYAEHPVLSFALDAPVHHAAHPLAEIT